MKNADAETDRYFFALWPAQPVRRQLEHAARTWLDACQGNIVPRRRTLARRYHLTLLYLGSIVNADAHRLQNLLADLQCQRFDAFELTLDRTGHFGSNVAWIGCGNIPPALQALHEGLARSTAAAGIAVQDGDGFIPHVTISRHAGRRCPAASPLAAPVLWPVSEYLLMRSVPAEGFAYRTVARLPLATERAS
jgi:RNA 2',3'-cyclic 3'-phosphodiesterase